MKKSKVKKISLIFILFVLLFSLFMPSFSDASVSKYTGKISDNTVFSSDYSFTPKFIKNVTTTQSYGTTDYAVDYLRTDSYVFNSENVYTARLTSNSQKGKIWVRYNNVGNYNGEIIDLKITLTDWNYLQPANLSASTKTGGVNYPTVAFRKDAIDVSISNIPAIDSPCWKFTFYRNGTNTAISIKNHITFKDFDGATAGTNEKIIFNSGTESAYISKNSYLTINSNYCVNNLTSTTSDSDINAWVTCLNNGSDLSFIYTRYSDIKGNTYRDVTKTASNTRTFYHYLIGAESLAPFEFSKPTKECNTTKLRGLEEATYTISHFVPGEASNFYYTSYVLSDQIANCFDIKSINILDDSKINRTSWFSISKTNNLLTITATTSALKNTNFYNNNFYFNITVSKKQDMEIEDFFGNSSSCIVPNTASLKISSPTLFSSRTSNLQTNTVNLTLFKEFVLPATGSFGDNILIILGFTFILVSLVLKNKKCVK